MHSYSIRHWASNSGLITTIIIVALIGAAAITFNVAAQAQASMGIVQSTMPKSPGIAMPGRYEKSAELTRHDYERMIIEGATGLAKMIPQRSPNGNDARLRAGAGWALFYNTTFIAGIPDFAAETDDSCAVLNLYFPDIPCPPCQH